MTKATHICPDCQSENVWIDANVAASWNPNKESGEILSFEIHVDDWNGYMRCWDCDCETDHAEEWEEGKR